MAMHGCTHRQLSVFIPGEFTQEIKQIFWALLETRGKSQESTSVEFTCSGTKKLRSKQHFKTATQIPVCLRRLMIQVAFEEWALRVSAPPNPLHLACGWTYSRQSSSAHIERSDSNGNRWEEWWLSLESDIRAHRLGEAAVVEGWGVAICEIKKWNDGYF